jgi:hypothetical protein
VPSTPKKTIFSSRLCASSLIQLVKTLFEGLDLASDDWEEMEEYEYAFV